MNNDIGIHLRELETQLAGEEESLVKVKEAAAAAQRSSSKIERRMQMIRNQIAAARATQAPANNGGITVSDHAVVRYLERAYGMNIDAVRAEMLDAKTRSSIGFLAGAKGKINVSGLTYIIENNTVITVVPNE